MKMMKKFSDDQMLIGIVLRGASERIEQTLKAIERDRAIEVLYVRRANPDSFLLIIETTRKVDNRSGGMSNAQTI